MHRRIARVVQVLVLLACPASGQTAGDLRGQVTDQTGAVITAANVTAVNESTHAERQARTDSRGEYSLLVLPAGRYSVTVRAPGFGGAALTGVPVRATETTHMDVQLQVGAAAEVVSVTGRVSSIQSDGPQMGHALSGNDLSALPLATRNVTQALALSAGVSALLPDATGVGRNTQAISVDGARVTQNNFRINGVDANTLGTNGPVLVPVPAPETIAEFKVQTAMYGAEYGRAGGANVQILTRGGGDAFHGSAYEYFRNEALDANDGFLKSAGVPTPALRRNVFGGTLGGPLRTGKADFFVSYQGTRELNGASLVNSISSRVLVAKGLTDDRSAATLISTFNPPAPIDPHSLALLNERLPNGSFVIPTPQADGTYTGSSPSQFSEDQFNLNADWRWGTRDLLSARFFFANTSQHLSLPIFRGSGANVPGFGASGEFNNRVLSLQVIHTFSSRTVNDGRLGYAQNRNNTSPDEPVTDADIGLVRSTASDFPGLPLIRIAPNAGGVIVGTAPALEGLAAAWTWTAADTLTTVQGRHTLHAGVEFRFNGINYHIPNFARGQIDFASFADFLIGKVQSSTLGTGLVGRAWRAPDYDFFVQDQWRLSPRFTLTLGARYELDLPVHDTVGRLSTFDPSLYSPRMQVSGGQPVGPPVGGFVQAGNVSSALDLSDVPNASDTLLYSSDKNNFAPRLGFAWAPWTTGRFVVRGGWGLFYSRPTFQYASLVDRTPPFYVLAVAQNKTFGNPFFPLLPPASSFPTFVPGVLLSGSMFDRRMETPRFQQFDLGTQYELGRSMVLELGYVGTRGSHLLRQVAINQAQLVPLGGSLVNPVTGQAITTNTQANALLRAPLQGVSINSFSQNQSTGESAYDSLQVTATRAMARGLQFQLAYTWSKSIDDSSGVGQSAGTAGLINTGTVGDTSGILGDQTRAGSNRGVSDFDHPHRLVASFIWTVPGGNGSRVRNALFHGWQMSGVAVVMSGAPIDVVDTLAGSLYGLDKGSSPLARPNVLPGATCAQAMQDVPAGYYFNATDFADPVVLPGQPIPSSRGQAVAGAKTTDIGNVGRNCLRGPAQANLDFAAGKTFHLRETRDLRFRADFLNAFNHENLADPISNINAVTGSGGTLDPNTGAVLEPGNLGRIISSSNNPRIIQLSLTLTF